jgi:uncharacterized membrane protein
VVLLALLLRLHGIGTQELWVDEAYSYLLATAPDWLGPATLANNTPPLYHFLLRGWMVVAGQDEAGLRLLSVAFGVLFVATVIWAGWEIFTPSVGLWSGAFAAIAPIHIFYSQEARTYSLLIFALALTSVLTWRALKTNTRLSWALVSCSVALSLYSHTFAVLGLLPTALLPWAAGINRSTQSLWRRYLAAAGVGIALFIPWVLASFLYAPHQLDDSTDPWLTYTWKQIPPALAIPKSLEILGLGGHAGLAPTLVKQFRILIFPGWAEAVGVAVLIALLFLAVVPWNDGALGISHLRRRKTWLFAALLFPLVTLWLGSYVVKPVYIVGRYDVLAFPAFTLLIGLAFSKLQHARPTGMLLMLGAGLLCVSLGTKLSLYYDLSGHSQGRRTAEFLDSAVANDDALVFTGPRGQVLLYYLTRLGYEWSSGVCRNNAAARRFFCRFIPIENEHTQLVYARPPGSSLKPLVDDLEQLTAALPSDGTLWLVFQRLGVRTDGYLLLEPDPGLLGEMDRLRFRVIPERSLDGIYALRRVDAGQAVLSR